jgi:hypothetical protein
MYQISTLFLSLLIGLSLSAAPGNDNPDGAYELVVAVGGCVQPWMGNNIGATESGDYTNVPKPLCGNYEGGDVWFKLQIPSSGNVIVAGGHSDFTMTRMAFYTNRGGEWTEITCATPTMINRVPKTKLTNLPARETLYIRIYDGFNDEVGNFEICAYEPPALRSNDGPEAEARDGRQVPEPFGNQAVRTSVFPNPASDFVKINGAKTAHLYDQTGQLLAEAESGRTNICEMSLYGIEPGVYPLIFFTENGLRRSVILVVETP